MKLFLGPKSALQVRVLFHVAHKQNNEEKLMNLHRQLQDVIEDQMCLASMHYMRSHFQEALDIYKRYLVENRYTSLLQTFSGNQFFRFLYSENI